MEFLICGMLALMKVWLVNISDFQYVQLIASLRHPWISKHMTLREFGPLAFVHIVHTGRKCSS